MNRSRTPIVLGIAIALAASACTASPTAAPSGTGQGPIVNTAPTPHTPSAGTPLGIEVDASVVRGSAEYDYDIYPNLSAAAEHMSVAATGLVVGWQDGRSILDHGDADRFAVLAVEVEGPAKSGGLAQDSTLYLSVSRGVEGLDEKGVPVIYEGQRSTVRTVDELAAAVPIGTRIIVLGLATASIGDQEYAPGVKVEAATAGLPVGAQLVDPYPQGLILETGSGGFVSALAGDDDLAGWAAHAGRLAGNDVALNTSNGSFENLLSELAKAVG